MVLNYRHDLKQKARSLRSNMTDAEQALWHRLRRKQLRDTQFFRQRPIDKYIVDFYAPMAKLVIELDGSQHQRDDALSYDTSRTAYLESIGIQVLRFDNLQVLNEIEGVLEVILQSIDHRKSHPTSL